VVTLNSTKRTPHSNLRLSPVRTCHALLSSPRATLARRRGGPFPGNVNPIEFSLGCRCIRHGPVTLMPGHRIDSNFTMTLCNPLV